MDDQSKIKELLAKLLPIHIVTIFFTLTFLLISNLFNWAADTELSLWQFISIISFIWIVWSWVKLKNTLFNPYGLFLIATFLFNLSWVILSLIPGNSIASLTSIFPTNIAVLTIKTVDLSFIGLHLGALLAVGFFLKPKEKKTLTIANINLVIVGYLLILVSIYPFYLTTKDAIQISLASGYSSLYQQSAVIGVLAGPTILAGFIIPGILFLLAGSKNNRANRLISLLLIIAFTILQLISGKRSTAIMPLIAYIWLWHKTIKPVNSGLISVFSLLFLFFVFPLIRISRDVTGIGKFSLRSVNNLFTVTNPLLDTLNEMGSSIKTISHTIQLIPLYRHFDQGVSYLYSLSTIIPNFFWKIHPAMQHGSLSSWLIATVDPSAARMGQGLGYSFIAEAYANFGISGSLWVSMILGLLFVSFSEFAETSKNRIYLAGLATYLSFFLFFARSESVAIVRPLFWYALAPVGLVALINRYRTKKMN